ncbi:MAG: collagen-like protein [Desulfuromusa sp.]|nr:collagen-like protein [Desulfuromusa sp.]
MKKLLLSLLFGFVSSLAFAGVGDNYPIITTLDGTHYIMIWDTDATGTLGRGNFVRLAASNLPAGPAGADGVDGTAGADGLDGKTIISGTVDPTTEGVDGDYYLNTTSTTLFGPKEAGSWPAGVSLIGPQGLQGNTGATGADGAQGIQGPTGPTGPAGADGAQGPQGVQGDTGNTGAQGIQGVPGATGATGADGSNGLTALILQTTEPAGANCTDGGQRIDVGLDEDQDLVLSAGEIDQTAYVCDGADGQDGAGSVDSVFGRTGVIVGQTGDYTPEQVGAATAAQGSNADTAFGWGDHSVAGYLTAAPVTSVAGKTGTVTLVPGDVGLGNVNNTADASKPVSTAQQTALDLKANSADLGTAALLNTGLTIGDVVAVVDVGYCSDTQYTDQSTCETNSETWTPVAGLSLTAINLPTAAAYRVDGDALTAVDLGGATAAQGTSADTAFGWGDHSVAGYLTQTTGDARYSLLAHNHAGVYEPADADLTDLADGSLTGWKIGTGINATNITTGILPDTVIPTDIARDTEIPTTTSALTNDSNFIATFSSGTSTLGTTAILDGTCATVIATTAPGTLSTDVIVWGFNANPTTITGYSPIGDLLYIVAYPTVDNVNFVVCNKSGSSITPGAITINWRVYR